MIKLLLILFTLLIPSFSYGISSQPMYSFPYGGSPSFSFLEAVTSSAAATCPGRESAITADVNSGFGTFHCSAGVNSGDYGAYGSYTLACPVGASGTPGTPGTCVCNSPLVDSPDGKTCVSPASSCDAGGIKNSSYGKEFTLPGSVGTTLCVGGCSFNVTDSITSSTGTYAVIGRAESSTPCTTATGLVSKPATPASPPTPASCLEQGQSYISMNSVTRCVSAGTAGAAPVTVTQNSQTAVTGGAGAGTSTTTTVDRQEGGQVTRTTTETPAGGGAAIVTTQTSPQSAFCEKNPDAAMCKEKKGSAGGGDSCTAPPSCDGDAILCAQLQQTWTARCESQTSSDVRTLGENVLNGADTLENKPDPNAPQVVPVGTLNTTEIFTGATCPAPIPMNFSVMGVSHSMSFDLAPFCTLGGVLGLLNVMASLFAAGRIIAGGI